MRDRFFFLLGAAAGTRFALILAKLSGEEPTKRFQSLAEEEWQFPQNRWRVEQEKFLSRLNQLQAEIEEAKYKKTQIVEPGEMLLAN